MKLRMQQLFEALTAAANPWVMEFDFQGLKFLKQGRHGNCIWCGLTFELTPTAEAGRLARAVQHKPARRAGKMACRSGSGAERGVRPHRAQAAEPTHLAFLRSDRRAVIQHVPAPKRSPALGLGTRSLRQA